MKRNIISYLMIALLTLAGCGNAAGESGGQTAGGGQPVEKPAAEATLTGTLVQLEEERALIATEEPALYWVSLTGAALLDEQQGALEQAALQGGWTVEIGFNGMVQETDPAQIGADYLQVTARGDDLIALYRMVLDDLWQTDPALNDGATLLALDLTGLAGLDEGEKAALTYLFGQDRGLETRQATYDELCQQGLIDEETVSFPTGLLFTLTDAEGEGDAVRFAANKWRSALGAYSFSDCQAQLGADGWHYTVGAHAIS